MSEARTSAGSVLGSPGTRVGSAENHLHLVLGLDMVLEDLKLDDDGVRRLENVRHCMPEVTVTFFTDLRASEVMDLLSGTEVIPPDHLLAEAGAAIHHRNAVGDMEADPEYREWHDFHGETRTDPKAAKAIGLEYLEIFWRTPRPLMVVGRPGPDTPLLGFADIPVLTETEGMNRESPFLTCRPFHLDRPGLSEVVKLLLLYLSARQNSRSREPGTGSKPSGLEKFAESPNAWHIQPGRLGRKGMGEAESLQGGK